MSATLSCQRCGSSFEAKRSDAMYCPQCKPLDATERSRRYENKHRIPCPGCGQPMVRGATSCRVCNNKAQPWRKVGEENANWKGGRTMANGYVYLRVKHKSGGAGDSYQAEHILVWEKRNGPLPKGYIVHHLNGIRNDNRIENLVALPRKRHSPTLVIEPHQRRILELENEVRKLKEKNPAPTS